MSDKSVRCVEIKFPAPICNDCKIPMATVTTIFDPLTPHPVKTVCYECQKCGDTLGSPRLRRHRVVLPLSRSTSPA
jgi:hypothetical protein